MYLRLHSEIDDNVFAEIDFDYVSSVGIDARWATTQINMKDGTVVRVKETPEEIMNMLAYGRLYRSLDRIIANEFR